MVEKKPRKADTSEDEAQERLADVAGVGQAFEGETTKMADIAGKDLTVLDFRFIPSQYREGDFACIQAKLGAKLIVVNTNADIITRVLRGLDKSKLPLKAKFEKEKGKSGREYWTIK